MTRPVRLQLSRRKGFSLQAATIAANGLPAVAVARPGIWGNPFTIRRAQEIGYFKCDDAGAQAHVVECFRSWISGSNKWWMGEESESRRAQFHANLPSLRGKNLACWCKPGEPCHADVLLELANA